MVKNPSKANISCIPPIQRVFRLNAQAFFFVILKKKSLFHKTLALLRIHVLSAYIPRNRLVKIIIKEDKYRGN